MALIGSICVSSRVSAHEVGALDRPVAGARCFGDWDRVSGMGAAVAAPMPHPCASLAFRSHLR